jgi:hypothetical protein
MTNGMAGSCSLGFSFSTVGSIVPLNMVVPEKPAVDLTSACCLPGNFSMRMRMDQDEDSCKRWPGHEIRRSHRAISNNV